MDIAKDIYLTNIIFNTHDLPVFSELSLHNFSLLEFFQESIEFLLLFETTFFEKNNFFNILKFYFKNSYFDNYNKYNVPGLVEIDSKISSVVLKKFAKLKQFKFVFRLIYCSSHDLLLNWIATGLFFNNRLRLSIFYKSFKLRLFT